MISFTNIRQFIKIGLIQTTLDDTYAWGNRPRLSARMNELSEEYVWAELKKGFGYLADHKRQPDLIVLPELSIPAGRERELKKFATSYNAVIIGGLDFQVEGNRAQNKAIVIIPENWPHKGYARRATVRYFGKSFFSYEEKAFFKEQGLKGSPDYTMYVLESGAFGRFGVAICSDFFDIERFVVYRGQIHHMLVISLNKDIESYYFLAEAIGRLVYCNVVICNSGFYGGSLAFSPLKEHFKRTIYKHEGKDLFTTQVVELPVLSLHEAQNSDSDENGLFKSKPPGYRLGIARSTNNIEP